ncbi:MAG: tRNA delta(2)-isopentenylpyrophosphate transferase [Bacteroidetes bacterium]|nr:tRNA delta(2)-isopentenylpyrophosphate transferase [Bacteroidota bacterium]
MYESGKKRPVLFVLLGPTGVGKTMLSLKLADLLQCPVISCDSRQFYKEMRIGTAAPTEEQLRQVQHYFVGTHSIWDQYNAGKFELDVVCLLKSLFAEHPFALMVGGSMLYIDAVCNGIDDLPTISPEIRTDIRNLYDRDGLEGIRMRLKLLDPVYYDQVDLMNVQRILHALEVCVTCGKPYSSMRTNAVKERPFDIVKIGLNRPREELYSRINARVDEMMAKGLENEAHRLLPWKNLNALQTVGYKELFNYFDGVWTKEFAVDMIRQNSRRYAKKQLSWFNRDKTIRWFNPDDENSVLRFVSELTGCVV